MIFSKNTPMSLRETDRMGKTAEKANRKPETSETKKGAVFPADAILIFLRFRVFFFGGFAG
jgi:hypothetical protein